MTETLMQVLAVTMGPFILYAAALSLVILIFCYVIAAVFRSLDL